jgi:hypothetical protein
MADRYYRYAAPLVLVFHGLCDFGGSLWYCCPPIDVRLATLVVVELAGPMFEPEGPTGSL